VTPLACGMAVRRRRPSAQARQSGRRRHSTGPAPVSLRARARPARAVVVVSGELDAAAAGDLAAELAAVLARQPARLIIDLHRVGFIDCAALRIIASAAAFLPAGGLALRRPGPAVRRLIRLTGLGAGLVTGGTWRRCAGARSWRGR
jgi:anti-sigma B factor antagonist